jgi:thiol-disulfide isomerase/thioredoxin
MARTRLRRGALLVATIALIAAFAGFGLGRWLQAPTVETPAGTPVAASDFALPELTGQTRRLADWRGKLVLLNFWATWCPPCREEIPLFIDLQKRYAGRGLQIVGISVDNPEAVARYWQSMRINYPLLLADESTYDLMAAYGNAQGGLPYSALIAPDGTLLATKLGAFHERELLALLDTHLPTATPAKN